MAYDASDRYTLALNAQSNTIRVPAIEQEENLFKYNDEIDVTVYLEDDDINSLTFTGYVDSDNRITIPASIRNRIGIEGRTTAAVTVSFEGTGERWSPEVESSARKAIYEMAHPAKKKLEAVTDVVSADD